MSAKAPPLVCFRYAFSMPVLLLQDWFTLETICKHPRLNQPRLKHELKMSNMQANSLGIEKA